MRDDREKKGIRQHRIVSPKGGLGLRMTGKKIVIKEFKRCNERVEKRIRMLEYYKSC